MGRGESRTFSIKINPDKNVHGIGENAHKTHFSSSRTNSVLFKADSQFPHQICMSVCVWVCVYEAIVIRKDTQQTS